MLTKSTQWQTVLEHLQTGNTVSNYEAFRMWNITRLGAVIEQIRKRGYCVTTTMEKSDNGNRYGRYRLGGAE